MLKKTKMFGFLMAAFVALSLIIADPAAYAKGSSGGGGRSSGGFSGGYKSSPAPSYKPSPAPIARSSAGFSGGYKSPAPAPVAKSSAGFSGGPKAPAAAVTPNAPVAKAVAPQRDAAAAAKTQTISKQQSQKAMADYKAQQAKFKYQSPAPVTSSPTVQRTVINRTVVNNYHYDPGVYAYRTRTFYAGYGWAPPVYGYGFYPSYGLWNTVALWFMLDHIHDQQYAMMYYSHRNDEDMRMWRQQAEREAQNNAELRAKLAAMDQRTRALEQQGAAIDPGYVPAEMKEVALSEDALKGAGQQQPQQPIATPAVYQQPAPVQPPPPQHKTPWGWILLGGAALAGLIYYFGFARKY